MTDKDREAFEAAFRKLAGITGPDDFPRYSSGDYVSTGPRQAWTIWQAARDHYAPKLTKKHAVYGADEAYHACRGDEISKMEAALLAAGVRFREES